MKASLGYEWVYDKVEEIPEDVLVKLNSKFLERFDGGIDTLFLEMKEDLPLCFEALKNNFAPKLGVRSTFGSKKISLVLEGEKLSLVSDLYSKNFYELYGIDREYYFFPKEVRSYYFLTYGFQVVAEGRAQLSWVGLPTSLINRERLDFYEGTIKRDMPYPYSQIRNYSVWCVCSGGDLIVVDEASSRFFYSCALNVYLLKEISDFTSFWDSYCSFVICSGSSDGFPFSEYCGVGAS